MGTGLGFAKQFPLLNARKIVINLEENELREDQSSNSG